jgi:hypothetical protein
MYAEIDITVRPITYNSKYHLQFVDDIRKFSANHRMTVNTLLLLIGIVILIVVFFTNYQALSQIREGFAPQGQLPSQRPTKKMARIPQPVGASAIPKSMPGATTTDPSASPATYKDVAALIDVIKTYNAVYEKFFPYLLSQDDYTELHKQSLAYNEKLQLQIDTGKYVDTQVFVNSERKKYEMAIKNINNNQPLTKNDKPNMLVKGFTTPVLVSDLQNAIFRAKQEQKRVDNLRSEAPEFKQRSLILEKIQVDLQQLVNKITRGSMKESQITVTREELASFLTEVNNPISKIKPLPPLKPAQAPKKVEQKRDYCKEDREAVSLFKSITLLSAIEGFSDGGMSDMEAQHYADSVIASKKQEQSEQEQESQESQEQSEGYVGDDDVFTPANKLDTLADIDEGFVAKRFQKPGTAATASAPAKPVAAPAKKPVTTKKAVKPVAKPITNKKGTIAGKKKPAAAPVPVPQQTDSLVSKLKAMMQDVAWDVNIEMAYDPNVTLKRRLMERINKISSEIDGGKLNREAVNARFMELEVLKQQLNAQGRSRATASKAPRAGPLFAAEANLEIYGSANTSANNINPDRRSHADFISPVNDYRASVRVMSDEEIQQRGSALTFDPAKVGQPDYKKNVKFLCSQIKDAGLGDPKQFGCIENQDYDVGPDYSWKGNYKMVCSRLGNTWGSWYPEMFGCPKPNTSHTQMPKVKPDCEPSKPPPMENPPKPKCAP